MAASRLAAAGRIAPHDQGPAAVAEIAGIAGVFRNLPQAGQANAVRMHQAAAAFPIRAPTQAGGRINGTPGGLPKHVRRTVRQDAVQQAAERDRVDWQRRLTPRPPCSLIGIGEQRFAHVGETRTAVGAVLIGDSFYPTRTRAHGGALAAGSSGRTAFAFATRAIADSAAAPAARCSNRRCDGFMASYCARRLAGAP